MGRGSSGGGGRSSGGHSSSSSHSSGGRMHSSGRGSSSFGRGRGLSSSSSFSSYDRYSGHEKTTYRHGRYVTVYTPSAHNFMMSFLSALVCLAIMAIWLSCISMANAAKITKSTVERTKLDPQYTTSTEFYLDELGWIRNTSTLQTGMKSFYNSTGVYPLLYITDTVNGTTSPTADDMATYASQLYTEYCPDEGHILFLFQCLDGGTEYNMWYECGDMAKIVMDEEACNILMDYIDVYFDSDRTDEEMFADSGKRIMTVTGTGNSLFIIIISVMILMVIAFFWYRQYRKQKNIEAQQTADILNADIHTISEDPYLSELEQKYNRKE